MAARAARVHVRPLSIKLRDDRDCPNGGDNQRIAEEQGEVLIRAPPPRPGGRPWKRDVQDRRPERVAPRSLAALNWRRAEQQIRTFPKSRDSSPRQRGRTVCRCRIHVDRCVSSGGAVHRRRHSCRARSAASIRRVHELCAHDDEPATSDPSRRNVCRTLRHRDFVVSQELRRPFSDNATGGRIDPRGQGAPTPDGTSSLSERDQQVGHRRCPILDAGPP